MVLGKANSKFLGNWTGLQVATGSLQLLRQEVGPISYPVDHAGLVISFNQQNVTEVT